MYDPQERVFRPIPPELAEKFASTDAPLTPTEKIQREWPRFSEGETVTLKGILFRVHEIGESHLILKPIKKDA